MTKNKRKENIEEVLEGVRFQELSSSEKDKLWRGVELGIDMHELQPVPSPWLKTNQRKMVPLIIGAMLFLSVGSTVVASNSAAPGDALFGVDRALEKFQIVISGEDRKVKLNARFAKERLGEVERLVIKARLHGSATSTNATSTNAQMVLGVNTALSFMNQLAADSRIQANAEAKAAVNEVIAKLENLINTDDVRVKIKSNGGIKITIDEKNKGKNDDDGDDDDDDSKSRIRLQIKESQDGSLRIRFNNGTSSSATTTTSTTTAPTVRKLEIDADVYNDKTIVKLEINGKKSTFITNASTSATITSVILANYKFLTQAQVEAALDLDIKNRPSNSVNLDLNLRINDDD